MSEKKTRGRAGTKAQPTVAAKPAAPAAVSMVVEPSDRMSNHTSSWGSIVNSGVALNSLGLPEEPTERNTSFIEAELGGITDRLHRALSDIATLYNNDEDSAKSKDDEIDMERRLYQSRLESLNNKFRSIERERETLLDSLKDIDGDADDDHLQEVHESSAEMPNVLTSLRERIQYSQSGYQRLKELNAQMMGLKRRMDDGSSGIESEVQMQAKVIGRFKEMYKARQTKTVDRAFGSHWKHAAGEIVGLLGRIRNEGKLDVEMLKKALENTEQLIAKQVKALARLEERVYEKQEEINKRNREFTVLESDNMLLKSEVSQYRDKVVDLKRKIRDMETAKKNEEEKSENEKHEDDVKPHRPDVGANIGDIPADLPTDVRGRRTFKKKDTVDTVDVKQQNEDLIDKVTTLEMKVIEKETKNMRMEHDVTEMLENIKVASPDAIRQLRRSMDITGYMPRSDDESNADDEDDDDPAKEVPINIGERPETRTPSIDHRAAPHGRRSTPSASPGTRGRQSRQGQGTPGKKRTPVQVLHDLSSPIPVQGNHDEPADESESTLPDLSRMTEQRNRLATELENVKKELARAKREIVSLQFAGNRGYVKVADHAETTGSGGKTESRDGNQSQADDTSDEVKPVERMEVPFNRNRRRSSVQPPNVAKLLEKVAPSKSKPSDERALYDQLKSQGLHKASPRRNVRVIRETVTRKVTNANNEAIVEDDDEEEGSRRGSAGERSDGEARKVSREGTPDDGGNMVSFEEFVIVDQGMQTDPLLDPLGAWSNFPPSTFGNMAQKRSASPRRPRVNNSLPIPPPPEEWTQYDPTPITGPKALMQDKKRGQKKNASRPGSAVDVMFFVNRELARIISGIRGFTAYVGRLLTREISALTEANEDIRRQMSERSLRRIERMIGNLDTEEKEEETAKSAAPVIRRGRFELMPKNNQASHFVTRSSFAPYSQGRRVVPSHRTMSVGASEDDRGRFGDSTLGTDRGQLSAPLVAEYLLRADEEAQRRLVAELGSGRSFLTSNERWNMEVDLIGQHASDVLRGICDFFKNTVDQQMTEHAVLTEGWKLREECELAMGGGRVEGDIPLNLKRSVSHGSFLEPNRHISTAPRNSHAHVMPPQSKSLSSVQSSHRYLPSLMIPRGYKPTNRDELVVPKAVLPEKGMVRLLAHGKADESMTDADKTGEGKKGHRPAPHSFRKLQEKQKGVMQRAGPDRKEVTTLKSILAELELPERSPQSSSLPARETVHSNTPVAGTTGKFPLAPLQYSSTQRVMRDAKRQLKHGDAVSGRLTVIFSR